MQATVKTFDVSAGHGTAVTDDGAVVAFSSAAFEASGLRLLRPGQRITLEQHPDGTVAFVTIVGFPGRTSAGPPEGDPADG